MEMMKQTLALVKRILKRTRTEHTRAVKELEDIKKDSRTRKTQVKISKICYRRGYATALADQISYYEKLREELEASIRVIETKQEQEQADDSSA